MNRGLRDHSPCPDTVAVAATHEHRRDAARLRRGVSETAATKESVGSAASNQGIGETATSNDTPAVDFQSAQMLRSRLDKPARRMCANFRGEDCYVIYLGPFWRDVAVPGLEDLASRGRADAEYINVCASCAGRLTRICEWQMREIREMSLQNTTIMCRDASVQLLDKAHVLILAQLKRQCAMAMRHGPV